MAASTTLFQILATTTGSLISVSDGMQYGWTSPILPLLMSSSTPVQIEESDVALLENIYLFGALLGFPITIFLLNRIGRKKTLIASAFASLSLWILIGFATNVTALRIARFIAGLSANINFSALPVYIAEISEKQVRGRLGTVVHVMALLGTILMYSVGPYVSMTTSSAIGATIVLLFLVTFSFMPESPYYLLIKNQKDEAQKSLERFRNSEDVEAELVEISEILGEEYAERPRLLDLLKIKSNQKVLAIMIILTMGESFSGITVLFMNVHLIFEDIPLSLSTNTLAILFSVVMCIGCIFAAFLVDKAGRVSLLFSSSLFTGISLLIISSYLLYKENVEISGYTWIPVATMMVYSFTYKYGVGLIPLVLASELFSTNLKAVGVSATCFTFVISSIISISIYHYFKRFGVYVPFYLFGGFCIFIGFFALFCIPETKGKSLEEIQELLNGNSRRKSNYEEIK